MLEGLGDQSKPFPARQEVSANLRALEEVLTDLEEGTRSSFDHREADKAERELQAARDLKLYVGRKRNQIDGSEARFRQQHRQMIRHMF